MHAKRWPEDVMRLGVVVLGVWLAAAVPAWLLAGVAGLEGLAWSAVLCFVPGGITLAAVDRLDERKRPVFGMLLGTGLRLAFAVWGGFVIALARPQLRLREFFGWLVLFYLITLAVETRLLLRERPTADQANRPGTTPGTSAGLSAGT